jgi:hypothetical protein
LSVHAVSSASLCYVLFMARLLVVTFLASTSLACGSTAPGDAGAAPPTGDDAGVDVAPPDASADVLSGPHDSTDAARPPGNDAGVDVAPPDASADVLSGPHESIASWTTCDGIADDWAGATKAFAAAKGGAFTLVIDCPLKVHIGSDIERPIFVENDTTVAFTGAGKLTIDNLFVPAFVMANTTKTTFIDWNVEWDGSMPVDPTNLGYTKAGVFVPSTGNGSGVFNDTILKPWLTKNRGIVFDQSQGYVSSQWSGPANMGALFFMTGDTSQVTVTGMNLYAPSTAGVDHFIPFAFMFAENFKSNQTVTGQTPKTLQYRDVPHDVVFSNISVDGTYMVWQGSTRNASFEHIRSSRYGDLQDANGGNVGGVGKWFPPPHLFYLNYDTAGDPALMNQNITITDVIDSGIRLGTARDKGGADTLSGYALSLKFGCNQCSVDGYASARPDGFMDVLSSNGLTVSNVTASFDSKFLNDVFPGWRWPQGPYANITFKNVSLVDAASSSDRAPIGNATGKNLVFQNVGVTLHATTGAFLPRIDGQGSNSEIDFTVQAGPSKTILASSVTAGFTLTASPTAVKVGGATTLTWTSTTTTTCTASGGWSGALAASGTKAVTLTTSGTTNLVLTCSNAVDTVTATMPVVVAP